jgi:hypothetical protein
MKKVFLQRKCTIIFLSAKKIPKFEGGKFCSRFLVMPQIACTVGNLEEL